MSRLFDVTASDSLDLSVALVADYPFSVSAWFNAPSNTSLFEMALWGHGQTTSSFRTNALAIKEGTDEIWATRGSIEAITTAAMTPNTWQHALGVWTSNTLRAVYLNGGNKGTNTTSAGVSGLNATAIGRRPNSGDQWFMDGNVGTVVMWDIALTDADAVILASGASALKVKPLNIVGYWPVWGVQSPEIDLSPNARSMIVTGTVISTTHPPITPFSFGRRNPFIEVAAPPPPPVIPPAVLIGSAGYTERSGNLFVSLPVETGEEIFDGALVGIDATTGRLINWSDATGEANFFLGIAQVTDETGIAALEGEARVGDTAGVATVDVDGSGIILRGIDVPGAGPANVGDLVFASDENTFTTTATPGGNPVGFIERVTGIGVADIQLFRADTARGFSGI